MQKAKKEDFRVEEELRSQKAKYEETSEDVYRRMQDIKEAEIDSVADLTAFLDAELGYYDRCRELLVQIKREWPARYVLPSLLSFVANLETDKAICSIGRIGNLLDHVPILLTHMPSGIQLLKKNQSQKCYHQNVLQFGQIALFHRTFSQNLRKEQLKSTNILPVDQE